MCEEIPLHDGRGQEPRERARKRRRSQADGTCAGELALLPGPAPPIRFFPSCPALARSLARACALAEPPPRSCAQVSFSISRIIMAEPRDKALQDYRKKLLEHKEIDGRLKEREWPGQGEEGRRGGLGSGAGAGAGAGVGPEPPGPAGGLLAGRLPLDREAPRRTSRSWASAGHLTSSAWQLLQTLWGGDAGHFANLVHSRRRNTATCVRIKRWRAESGQPPPPMVC